MRKLDPSFKPVFTPAQMLQLGVFEGTYLNGTLHEYPKSWCRQAKICKENDPSINLLGVRSGLSLAAWQERGWITKHDPLGWFQWYCRYYSGRRMEGDALQIQRWRNFARHSGQVILHGKGDLSIRPVQRQALLQWTYDPFPDVKTKRSESIFEKAKRLSS